MIILPKLSHPNVLMSLSGMVEIPRLQAKRRSVMPAQAGIQVTDSVRHTVGKRYPGEKGVGMDPGVTIRRERRKGQSTSSRHFPNPSASSRGLFNRGSSQSFAWIPA